MKKYCLLGFIVGVVILSIFVYKELDNYVYEDEVNIVNTNGKISMMIEDENGEYVESNLSSWPGTGYKFNAELSKCENGSILKWDDEARGVIFEGSVSDKCYVYFDVYSLSEFLISKFTGVQGENGLYYHDSSLANGAGDNSYRYAGENPNNYVCFGTDADVCPKSNLFRIIGVFDGYVKLISAEAATIDMLGNDGAYERLYSETRTNGYYVGNLTDAELANLGSYNWNGNTTVAVWKDSYLNQINLNTNFINFLGSKWANKINDSTWQLSTVDFQKLANVPMKEVYQNEIVSPNSKDTYTAKIALPYVSDYGFASDSVAWNSRFTNYTGNSQDASLDDNNYTAKKYNEKDWMYMGVYGWCLTIYSSDKDPYYYPVIQTFPWGFGNGNIFGFFVKPTFYLKKGISYVSGTGTETDPIRVS